LGSRWPRAGPDRDVDDPVSRVANDQDTKPVGWIKDPEETDPEGHARPDLSRASREPKIVRTVSCPLGRSPEQNRAPVSGARGFGFQASTIQQEEHDATFALDRRAGQLHAGGAADVRAVEQRHGIEFGHGLYAGPAKSRKLRHAGHAKVVSATADDAAEALSPETSERLIGRAAVEVADAALYNRCV
jgi:hypothetical protein